MANLDALENIPSSIERSPDNHVPSKQHGRAVLARANQTERKATESGSENESSDDEVADDEEEDDEEEDESDDDDESDDGDDESDQPSAFAPPRGQKKRMFRQAGQIAEYRRMFRSEDPVLYEDPNDLFGGAVEDDEDDDLYRAVDDISDDDEQGDEMFQLNAADADGDASLFLAGSGSPFLLADPEHEVDFILDQVDGLSAYGFGDDLDTGDGSGESSTPSEDGGDVTVMAERHVHFGPDVERMSAYWRHTSPSLTRALLPSAMSFGHENDHYALDRTRPISNDDVSVAAEEAYDSDATEVISPPPTPLQHIPSVTNVAKLDVEYVTHATGSSNASANKQGGKRSSRRRKGPRRGLFDVDRDKSWAILDPTRKKVLQIPAANTNRHAWLDEMSQSTSTPSSSASPRNASLKIQGKDIPESMASAASMGLILNTAIPDVMMAGLSGRSSFADTDHGQTVGPPEAFYSNGLQLVGGDYAVTPDPESDGYDEEATPMIKKPGFPLQEFLEDFEDDDDSDEIESGLPLYAPADDNLTGDPDALFGHLNNVNVTAFRRSADPISASRPGTSYAYELQTSPMVASSFAIPALPARTPTTSHKRKISSTPYQDEKIYGDVTPVERKVIHVSKRRKMVT